jgi:hypothetical protein
MLLLKGSVEKYAVIFMKKFEDGEIEAVLGVEKGKNGPKVTFSRFNRFYR